jgi:hypothetical protein
MGAEAKCSVTFRARTVPGKALLETDALIFRASDLCLSISYSTMTSVRATGGDLRVKFKDGVAEFHLGRLAEKWAARILSPPSRADKLGVKPQHRVLIIGLSDPGFRRELEARGARISSRAAPGMDAIFYAASDRRALDRLDELQDYLKRDGAIWIVRPKGREEITESDVMKAGKAAGLVDVKVVRFSETHTAEKFVIPLARR